MSLAVALAFLLAAPRAGAFEEAGSAERHLKDMIGLLQTGQWTERIHAVHELEYMHDEAIPGLGLAMEDGDWQVRLTAVQALSPRNVEGVRAMKKLLRYETCPVVRLMTMHALGSLGPDGDEQLKEMSWISSASTRDVNKCRDQAGPGRAPWARGVRQPAGGAVARAALPERAPPARARAEAEAKPAALPAEEADAVVTRDPVPPAPAEKPKPKRPPEEPAEPTKFQRRIELDAILDAPPEPGRPESLGKPFGVPGRAEPDAPGSVALRERGRAKAPASEVIARGTGTPESLGRPFAVPGRAAPAAPEGTVVADAGTGKEEADPVPELLRALKRADPRARARAADELGRRGAGSEPAVPALMAALRDKSPRVRSSAGLALGNIGASREGVVPLLISALKDRSEDVRYAAALALSRIDTPEAKNAFRAHVGAEARATIERPKVKSR